MSLTLAHARLQLVETVRTPIAMIGSAFFPAAAMLAFVVPFVGRDPRAATLATASMVTYAVMTTNLFQYGIGVATDRAEPWDPYTRTLPVGAGPRFAGRILAGLVLMLISLTPVVVIAAVATEASVTALAGLAAVGVTAVIAVPFTLMGLGIGYALPAKAAVVVAQVLFLPLAIGGGLLTPPDSAPGFVQDVAPFLPTGGGVQLMWAAVAGYPPPWTSVLSVAGWTAAFAGLAAWAYRRDEGRRFS